MDPQIWFVHFRAEGDAIKIAGGIKAALDSTSTPFPQTLPKNPTSPLDKAKLRQILNAQQISIGSNGVVTA